MPFEAASGYAEMTPSRRTVSSLALLLSSSLLGCAADPTSPIWASLTLGAAKERWQKAGLTNYSFTSSVTCFCRDEYVVPMRVTVRHGQVTDVVDIRTGASRPLTYRQPVDSIFGLVRVEIRERPERLTVSYDRTLGFPRTLTYGTPENDGGGYITIDSVQAIP